jgi:N-acetylmuramic acid 6-phosphate etherase
MDHLLTEANNPASTDLDRLTPRELVRLMNGEDAGVARAVACQADKIAQAIEVAADRLRAGGRLVYLGAGTSGRLGVLDAAECPPTFNSAPDQVIGLIAGGPPALTHAVEGAEDHPEAAEHDLEGIGLDSKDVLVGIATSGRTPYVQGGLAYARRVGAFAIGLSCNPASELVPLTDLMITPLVGPEVVTGSTRLKAGTATKLVLNTLSTGVMVRLGKTYGNLMVDLRATNSKLRARSNRIVCHFTALTELEAEELLARCGGELKTALVAGRAGVAADVARRRLAEAGGQVRVALEGLAPTPSLLPAVGLVLGIDGGGTHTSALLADPTAAGDRRFLGRGSAGPSNLQTAGEERAFLALEEAVTRAFAAARMPRAAVEAACLGLAGAGRPADQAAIHRWAGRFRLAERVEVTTDAALLLAAGTPEGWGLALVAGTGSMAFGRTADGHEARSGGWGPLLGDEGSGYDLALAGLRAVARAADGRGLATALTGPVLDHLDVREPAGLIAKVHGESLGRPELAALAPLVLKVAQDGDAVAVRLVDRAADDLAAAVWAVAERLALAKDLVPLALAGALLLSSEELRRRMLDRLAARGLRISPVGLVQEPAEGAVRIAAQAAGR